MGLLNPCGDKAMHKVTENPEAERPITFGELVRGEMFRFGGSFFMCLPVYLPTDNNCVRLDDGYTMILKGTAHVYRVSSVTITRQK